TATELPVDLRKARALCDLIDQDHERPIEVFNNLGHMFVLLQAANILLEESLAPRVCAPTQQSDDGGRLIADLEGDNWALEAFGGVDITTTASSRRICASSVMRTPKASNRFWHFARSRGAPLATLPKVNRARLRRDVHGITEGLSRFKLWS